MLIRPSPYSAEYVTNFLEFYCYLCFGICLSFMFSGYRLIVNILFVQLTDVIHRLSGHGLPSLFGNSKEPKCNRTSVPSAFIIPWIFLLIDGDWYRGGTQQPSGLIMSFTWLRSVANRTDLEQFCLSGTKFKMGMATDTAIQSLDMVYFLYKWGRKIF